MLEIVPTLRAASGVEVTLVADDPALSLFERHDLQAERFPVAAVPDGETDGPQVRALRDYARELLRRCRPDALLVGLSGPGIGLDEALLAEAEHIPTYAVQDYPGWVVTGFEVFPGTYFVNDAEARRLTAARRPQARLVVSGAAKYATYARLGVDSLRSAGRSALAVTDMVPVIGFYGQPLWFLAGYERAIADFARAAAIACPGAVLFYRPHPKEDTGQRRRIVDIFAETGLSLRLDLDQQVEKSLAAADMVVTCFSSCGMDRAYLQRYAGKPLGGTLFLLTEGDIGHYHARETGVEVPPAASEGLALMARQAADLPDLLRDGLAGGTREGMWRRARAVLPDPGDAARRILETLRDDAARFGRT